MNISVTTVLVSHGVIINSYSVSSVYREKYTNKRRFHSQLLFCQIPNEMKPKQAHYKI